MNEAPPLGPALIADDEPWARAAVREALHAGLGSLRVEERASGHDTVQAVRALSPCVLFLDVGLPDLDGFEVLRALGPDAPPVVMVTGSSSHALPAYQQHVVDYVVKPFSDTRLLGAARRALHAGVARAMAPLADQLLAQGKNVGPAQAERALQHFAVRRHDRTIYVAFDEVDYIRAEGNYAVLCGGGTEHWLRATLTALEERAGGTFWRIHRSTLVHQKRVVALHHRSSGDADVELADGRRLRMSRRYRATPRRDS